MRFSIHAAAVRLFCAFGLLSLVSGCSEGVKGVFMQNERPTLDLTQAPVSTTDRYFYYYRMNWIGNDPDGRVDHYLYAKDPPTADQVLAGRDTAWILTRKNEELLQFTASIPDTNAGAIVRASEPHVFVIKAIDDKGLASAVSSRAFFSYTTAPSVQIMDPTPSRLLAPTVTPSVRIEWVGNDADGQLTQKPTKYKWKLLSQSQTEFPFEVAKAQPDSIRRFYAARAWAGWDSTSADTQFVQIPSLSPNQQYVFVVISFDEAGAYSPIFSREVNVLVFNVGFAGVLGPRFTVFNEFFNYTYASGGYAPNEPTQQIRVEVAADRRVTFNWIAEPPAGATMRSYRWCLDLQDLSDETPRNPEATDWNHWSQRSNLTLSCTIGPFGPEPPNPHTLYIEGEDNNGLKSLAIVVFTVVRPTFEKPLLIVDDARLEPDKPISASNPCPRNYALYWPSAAELDTFFYARGGTPLRCPAPANTYTSQPGVFAGYSFDTTGTRRGLIDVGQSVPLALLGRYRHIIWLIDSFGATNSAPGTDQFLPMCAMRYMSDRGRANTLSAYARAGGDVWTLGAGTGYASMIPWNRRTNDVTFQGILVFSFANNELVPGRMLYDLAHWQSEFRSQGFVTPTVVKSPSAVGGYPGAPSYSRIPTSLHLKDLVADPPPPARVNNTASFYLTFYDIEYLSQPNFILEDVDPDPAVVNEQSVLDTVLSIMVPPGQTFGGVTNTNPLGGRDLELPVMTYYHGQNNGTFLNTGLDLWKFSRADVVAVVDFVLQDVWHLTRSSVARNVVQPSASRAVPPSMVTPAQRVVRGRLPLGNGR